MFLKHRNFIIQERFNKLIHGINTIIKCSTGQSVNFQLVSCSWTGSKNEMIFFLSYLWINVETNWNFTGCQVLQVMIVLIPYINLLNISWIVKMSFLWEIRSLYPVNAAIMKNSLPKSPKNKTEMWNIQRQNKIAHWNTRQTTNKGLL